MRVIVEFGFPYWLRQTWFNVSPRVISIQDLIEDIVALLDLPKARYSLSAEDCAVSSDLYAWEFLQEGQVLNLASPATVPLSTSAEESYQANIEEFQHTAVIEEGDFIMFKSLDRDPLTGVQVLSQYKVSRKQKGVVESVNGKQVKISLLSELQCDVLNEDDMDIADEFAPSSNTIETCLDALVDLHRLPQ